MADTKLTAVTAQAGAVVGADIFYGVDDPAGTPASVKVTATQLKTFMSASPTITGTLTVPDGSGAAPAIQFASAHMFAGPGVAFCEYLASNPVVMLAASGDRAAVTLGSANAIGWSSLGSPTAAIADTVLYRDAAYTIAQRQGTNAQAFRLYNTYTDASNYERIATAWSSNVAYVVQEYLGTGSFRGIFLGVGPAGSKFLGLDVNSSGLDFYIGGGSYGGRLSSSGHFKLISTAALGFQDSTGAGGTIDAYLSRDAAGVLAQRNSTTAQAFRLYSTYTDASNYERLALQTSLSGTLQLAAETAGTGADNLNLRFTPAGTGGVAIGDVPLELFSTVQLLSVHGSKDANTLGMAFRNSSANGYTEFNIINDTQDDTHYATLGVAGTTAGSFANSLFLRANTGLTNFYLIVANTAGDIKIRNADASAGAALNFLEQTAPSAPSSNQVVLYAEDNGSGKTRLMARFASGAAQQVAIEP
jgi:hypothetical protein